MKKLLLFFAALLPCFLAHSQEAEENGRYAEFQLIPRFDFNPYFTPGKTGDGSSGYTFGNSSIYTLIEGAFSEHVSFTFSNHWLSAHHPGWEETAGLYTGTLYSNGNNWVDIAKFDFSFGNWEFTIGKDCLASGGFEYDDWDVDVDYLTVADDKPLLVSNLWYNLPCYQWGARVGYNIGEHTNLSLQMASSPFGERPFASGLFSYSAKWNGNYGPLANMWSASAVQKPDGSFDWLIALSQQAELGDFTVGFDWYNISDVDYDDDDAPCGFLAGNTVRPRAAWAISDQCDWRIYSNIYTQPGEGLTDLNVGSSFHYCPFDFLQLHAAFGWDLTTRMMSAMAGIKVNFTFLSL